MPGGKKKIQSPASTDILQYIKLAQEYDLTSVDFQVANLDGFVTVIH